MKGQDLGRLVGNNKIIKILLKYSFTLLTEKSGLKNGAYSNRCEDKQQIFHLFYWIFRECIASYYSVGRVDDYPNLFPYFCLK